MSRPDTPDTPGRIARRWPRHWPLRPLPKAEWPGQPPTYAAARPALIEAAVKRAQARPAGNWFVLAASRQIHGDRPFGTSVASVATLVGVWEPADIVANRLDPWHGSWFHPYSFSRLSVLSAPGEVDVAEEEDRFLVSVTFRVAPGLGVPVRAEFSCPGPRTVVMRITEGEGAGSVVETHAIPRGRGVDGRPRTAVIEAVIAESGRPGFAFARAVAPVLRPVMRRAVARLWRDDLAYAERRYQLRSM